MVVGEAVVLVGGEGEGGGGGDGDDEEGRHGTVCRREREMAKSSGGNDAAEPGLLE